MRIFLTSLFLVLVNLTSAQEINQSAIDYQLLDDLLQKEIAIYRDNHNLPTISPNEVLIQAARHHSEYMSRSRMVSHYQPMNLPFFNNLNTPRERVEFFSGSKVSQQNRYSEVCLGIKLKNVDSYQQLAQKIFADILASENKQLLDSREARYIGLSVRNTKHTYYTTIKLGMGYDNIVALLAE